MAKNEITENGIAKQKAYTDILDWLTKEAKNVPAEVLEAAKQIRPSYFGIGGFGVREGDGLNPAYRRLKALFPNGYKVGDSFTDLDAFQTNKAGARDVHIMCHDLIKFPVESEPIVWIKEDHDSGIHTIVAIQNEVPEGWDQKLPTSYAKNFADFAE